MEAERQYRGQLRTRGSVSSVNLTGWGAPELAPPRGARVFVRSHASTLGASPLSAERAVRLAAIAFASASVTGSTTSRALASAIPAYNLDVLDPAQAPDPHLARTREAASFAVILRALDEEEIEDGTSHPAESLLRGHLDRYRAGDFAQQLKAQASSTRAAALLRLFGRSERVPPHQRQSLLRWALRSPDVELRDAAVQAAENWEDAALVPLLQEHEEPVPWLGAYKAAVARELQS